jgi:Cu(I)/Ag(I) efflux system membrane protein CusA/SilA
MDRAIQFPGLTNVWVMPIKNRIDMLATGIKTPVGIKVAGPELSVIQDIGRRLETVLADVPGTASVYSERVAGGRYIDVNIDRDRAARYGMNIADIQDIVRTAIGGMQVTETVEGLERYPVNLRYPRDVRDSVEKLKLLPIVTPAGARVALADVADIRVTDGPSVIKSENARLNGWVYVDIADRDLGSYVNEAQQVVADQVDLPTGYSLSWSGQYEYMLRAKERLKVVGPLTLAIIVLLLFLNFRRMTEVVMIMGTLPLALVGGVLLLYAMDYQLSVAVGVGFIALAGVAVEIGVLMLVYLNQALDRQKQKHGQLTAAHVHDAVVEGALLRIRPIIMTVAAIIGGLVPIMIGSGTGSEVMRRIAAPMLGGMISATVLTLLVIPALFLLWNRRRG